MIETPAPVRLSGRKRLEGHASAGVLALVIVGAVNACSTLPSRADAIEKPLTNTPGDAARGREVFVSREGGNCVLCHSAPGVATAGNIAPPIHGAGARFTVAQLRLRVVDITRVNPDAAMPAFHRVIGLNQVASRYRDQPVLSAQQVEDVVAYLGTLK